METAAAPETPSPAVAARPLSEELALLAADFHGQAVGLRTVIEGLRGRAYELLMIVLSLPFAVPVSVPGMSTPFGIAITVIAVQLARGRLPWLPKRLLEAKLPPGFFSKVMKATQGVVKFLEKFLRARLPALTATRGRVGFHLLALALAAVLLALPLPIPFTNMIPGWSILLIALGLMERDGLFIIAGHVVLWFTCVYFLLVGESMRQVLQWVLHRLGH